MSRVITILTLALILGLLVGIVEDSVQTETCAVSLGQSRNSATIWTLWLWCFKMLSPVWGPFRSDQLPTGVLQFEFIGDPECVPWCNIIRKDFNKGSNSRQTNNKHLTKEL